MIAGHALLFELNMKMRAATQLQNWTRNVMLIRKHLQKQNVAATKIQAVIKGYLIRKKLPQIKYELHMQKQVRAVTLIQVNCHCYTFEHVYYVFNHVLILNTIGFNYYLLLKALWRGYCIRKRYQCRRVTNRILKKGARTLGRRHNDAVDVLNRQKINEYSYRKLVTVFWNLGSVRVF